METNLHYIGQSLFINFVVDFHCCHETVYVTTNSQIIFTIEKLKEGNWAVTQFSHIYRLVKTTPLLQSSRQEFDFTFR